MEMLNSDVDRAADQREAYLVEVSRHLSGQLTPLQAYESLCEMRGHLDSMADAYEEVGMDRSSAMEAALKQFGPCGKVGSEMAGPGGSPIRFALGLFATIMVTAAAALLFEAGALFYSISREGPHWPFFVLALLQGAIFGSPAWISRWKPMMCGLFAALEFGIVLAFVVLITHRSSPGSNLSDWLSVFSGDVARAFALGVVASAFAHRLRRVQRPSRNPVTS